MEKVSRPFEIYDADLEYLKEIAAKHKLPSVDKAIRCLIAHAQENPGLEKDIFEAIHCTHC